MEKQDILKQIELIKEKKQKAVLSNNLEKAAQYRDHEKELMKKLDILNNNKTTTNT